MLSGVLGQKWGGALSVGWGIGLLYAAWKPDSLPGRFLVGPYGSASRFAEVRRYWCGGLGVVFVLLGVIFFILA